MRITSVKQQILHRKKRQVNEPKTETSLSNENKKMSPVRTQFVL